MIDERKVVLAGPMVIQPEGSLDFRIVVQEWKHKEDGTCIEWVCHREFHPRDDEPPYHGDGRYARTFPEVVDIFNDRWKLAMAYHNPTEAARVINWGRQNVHNLQEQWDDMGQKIRKAMDEVERQGDAALTDGLVECMRAIHDYYEMWSKTVSRYLSR